MATLPLENRRDDARSGWLASLSEPRDAIGGPLFDALCLWGSPLLALIGVNMWLGLALNVAAPFGDGMARTLATAAAILTFAHLIAVAPRAYLNRDVFAAHRIRLTLIPVLLIAALMVSPALLTVAVVVTVFWDVHHSAMQNFGLSRIYDLKAGNDPERLRRTDLRLNWILYVGPLIAGASFPVHVDSLRKLETVDLVAIARLPGILETGHAGLVAIAIGCWLAILLWAVRDYRVAIAQGYRLAPHKFALLLSTGLVSLLAWGFSSPLVALVAINIYHAVQYFALVWLKEGRRMTTAARMTPRRAFGLFLGGSLLFGIAYHLAASADLRWIVAPFTACSLIHFWFDGFVWSVRKRQV